MKRILIASLLFLGIDALSEGIFTKLDADKNTSLSLAEVSELPAKLIAK